MDNIMFNYTYYIIPSHCAHTLSGRCIDAVHVLSIIKHVFTTAFLKGLGLLLVGCA